MEKLKLIIPVLFLFMISSCYIDRTPDYVEACFTVSGIDHTVNDPVYFVNCSRYAVSFEWSFGDGLISNERNPRHYYDNPGTYQVTLEAYDTYGNYDRFTTTVTVLGSTDLDILVLFEGTNISVPDCEVTLYGTELDWQEFTNPLISGTTGSNGIVIFTGLDPVVYYIDAFLDGDGVFYDNSELGYITDPLIEDQINEYNIYIRQYPDTKQGDRKNLPIVKIEKSSKEERERILKANLSN
jgi:PKD repeat protein